MQVRFLITVLIIASTFCSPFTGTVVGQTDNETKKIRDTVSTLSLSDTLYTWGRLGGMAVDRLGFIYISNFADAVWRVTPEGDVVRLTSSLYGASGNAVDSRGDLLQSNFFANTISKITRTGEVRTYASEGLAGPVGIAVDAEDNLYVCNCGDNTIVKVVPCGQPIVFANGDLFNCPNGITFDDANNLYVVNFSNDHVVKIAPDGSAEKFATVPGGGGSAHIVFTRGYFYVTKIRTNQVYRVTKSGEAMLVAGTGQLGFGDGAALEATLSRPNGIAVAPSGDILYINNLVGIWGQSQRGSLVIRKIELASLTDLLLSELEAGGIESVRAAYHNYKKDPARQSENTEQEMNQLGFQLLRESKLRAAIAIFELNTQSYRDSWRTYNSLAEAFKIGGKTELAIQNYQKSLDLNPNNTNAISKLKELRK